MTNTFVEKLENFEQIDFKIKTQMNLESNVGNVRVTKGMYV